MLKKNQIKLSNLFNSKHEPILKSIEIQKFEKQQIY